MEGVKVDHVVFSLFITLLKIVYHFRHVDFRVSFSLVMFICVFVHCMSGISYILFNAKWFRWSFVLQHSKFINCSSLWDTLWYFETTSTTRVQLHGHGKTVLNQSNQFAASQNTYSWSLLLKTFAVWLASPSRGTTSADCICSWLASTSVFSHLNRQHMWSLFVCKEVKPLAFPLRDWLQLLRFWIFCRITHNMSLK